MGVCALITKEDLQEAIAECQGTRNPNANTAIKLAAFYTILDHLDNDEPETVQPRRSQADSSFGGYSFNEAQTGFVQFDGDSDFAKAINGKRQSDVWSVMDELMSTIKIMNERLYNGVMRKL